MDVYVRSSGAEDDIADIITQDWYNTYQQQMSMWEGSDGSGTAIVTATMLRGGQPV